jgi:isopenicillin N synthase-like dioxygenase
VPKYFDSYLKYPLSALRLLHSDGKWIAAPYIPGSVGDSMAKVSGGRWVATTHRVRATNYRGERQGTYLVLFFFEPDMDCVIKAVE